MNKTLKNIAALAIGVIISIAILEIFLHAFNPFPVRVKNNQIILPANRTFHFHNTHLPSLDKNIVHSKNSLGFRGPERPYDRSDYLSIIAVGGSTTECRFLNDGMDWVSLLSENLRATKSEKIWVNNAGLDGHSTFGHQVLLQEYLVKLRPNYLIYLIGVNELERADLNYDDETLLKRKSFSIADWLKKNSEIALLINNLRRSIWSYQIDLQHGNMDLKTAPHTKIDTIAIKKVLDLQEIFLLGFEKRLNRLLEDTKKAGITPIVLTQPLLFGVGHDDITGVNLETIKTRFKNGKTYWEVLEAYNDITRKVAQSQDVFLIDLAHQMPKSSVYFYDGMHFTNEGAEKVSEIIAKYDFFINQ